jgi:peptidyl-prolyl cis-trans isomerase SurA
MRKLLFVLFLFPSMLFAQGEMVDEIIAVVGDEIVLHSDVQSAILEMTQGKTTTISPEERCKVIETLLYQKLLLNQSKIDSVEVSDAEVDQQVGRRLDYFVQMFGSTEQFEQYYGKTTAQMKEEYFDMIKDQLLVQKMQGEITKDVKVTPSDVMKYYDSVPKDSLPLINEQLKYSQIVIDPEMRESEVQRTIGVMDSLRLAVMNGKTSMTLIAAKFSEDPGSKYKGGCYPLQRKGSFVPEYEAAVFNTPEGSYTPVFKSEYGYHFVKVVEIRGDFYEACHVLVSPKVYPEDLDMAKVKLDSLSSELQNGNIKFKDAAVKYSTDKDTKNQEGRVTDSYIGSKHSVADLDPETNLVLMNLEVGQVSEPVLVKKRDGSQAYVIYKLDDRIPAHRASLELDYEIFKRMADEIINQEATDKWVRKTINNTFININAQYQGCPYDFNWIKVKP